MLTSKHTILTAALLTSLSLGGCLVDAKQIGDLPGDEESSGNDPIGDGDLSTTGDGDGDGEPPFPGDGDGEPGPFDDCEGPFSSPSVDLDCDGWGIACDNAPEVPNPGQHDEDGDAFGDAADLCVLTPSEVNTADIDHDGFGDDCDRCRRSSGDYNLEPNLPADPRMWVRNIPLQRDTDRDGIGDACDNCVAVANCGDFDDQNPHIGGQVVPDDDPLLCQADLDGDMIGDACLDPQTLDPIELDGAAGPVELTDSGDFDQDGVVNVEDRCPRLALREKVPCTDDLDCGPDRSCALLAANDGFRYCNHSDIDSDLVGDRCDTCPHAANPMQVDDVGMQIDDEDGDFVGAQCETHAACTDIPDPRPIGFYDVEYGGTCCVATYPGDGAIHDPDGVPVTLDCSPADEAADLCRSLPPTLLARPGVVSLPPGCEAALAEAGVESATALTLADVGNDDELLWQHACYLPQRDQDYDGVGDACDLCPFAFDPSNTPYTDDQDMVWDDIGQACAGANADNPGALCMMP